MSIAARVRDCRYAKGWGPDELASRASISRTALYQIECGKTEAPRAGTLRRIAEALDVPIESLLGREGAPRLEQARIEADRPLEFSPDSDYLGLGSPTHGPSRRLGADPEDGDDEIVRKFRELLETPLGQGVARIVEDSYRLLPAAAGGMLRRV